MITTANYFDQVKKLDLAKLPEELRKSHSFIEKASKNGTNWTLYNNNEAIRKMIDLHFELIRELPELKQAAAPANVPVVKARDKKISKNLMIYAKGRKDKTFSAQNISNGSFGPAANLLHANIVKPEGIEKTKEALRELGRQFPDYTFQLREAGSGGKVVWEYQYHHKKDEAKKSKAKKEVKKPTPKKAATKEPTTKPAQKETGKKVAHLSEELRLIRRFINYDGRTISKKTLLNFTKALQKAITERKVRKASKNGKIVANIQEKALKALKAMNDNGSVSITLTFDGDWGKKVKEIANAEVVYNSIPLIKRFIGIMGEKPSLEKVERLKKAITSAMTAKKVTSSDIYYKELKEILDTIEDYIAGKRKNLKIQAATLSGLEDEIENLTENTLEEVQEVGK
jgi:stringent starvation protein B